MNKKNVFVFTIIILVSCHNNNTCMGESEDRYLKPKLAPCIEEAFAYYIGSEDDHDTSYFYMMSFSKGEPGCPENDTMLSFCKYHDNMLAIGLRGITNIGEYKLLVFDDKNVGKDFYNLDSLRAVDLGCCGLSYNEDIADCCTYVLDGSMYLKIWGIQPDDYVPIKIR